MLELLVEGHTETDPASAVMGWWYDVRMAHSGKLLPLLSNRYEKAADELLQTFSADTGDRLVSKMRLADVVDIDSLDDRIPGARWFALSAQLDFVMVDRGSFLIPSDDGKGFVPSTFDAHAIRDLWKLYGDGLTPRPVPNTFRVKSGEDRGVRAIAYLPVAKDRYLISESRVRDFRFQSISPYDLAEEICVVDIANSAADWVAGKPVARNSAAMRKKAQEIQRLIDNGHVVGFASGTRNIEGSEGFSIRMTHLAE